MNGVGRDGETIVLMNDMDEIARMVFEIALATQSIQSISSIMSITVYWFLFTLSVQSTHSCHRDGGKLHLPRRFPHCGKHRSRG